MLHKTLEAIGLSNRQVHVYLAALQLGASPASSIARVSGENRVTTYGTLKELINLGYAQEITRNKVKYYSVIEPNKLLGEYKKKVQDMEDSMPELLGLMHQQGNKPKMFFYDGIDQLKKLFFEIIEEGNNMPEEVPFLTFLGTQEIDPSFESRLIESFVPSRIQHNKKTLSIMSKNNSVYNQYTEEIHDSVSIDNPIFSMRNEIVMYGNNKVALLLYNSQEMSGIVIESQSLHDSLTQIFYIVREAYKK